MHRTLSLAAAFVALYGLSIVAAAADAPRFDIASMCRESTEGTTSLNACIKDESDARDQLARQWEQFNRQDAERCTSETKSDGTPSYIELLTCVTMARDARKLGPEGLVTRQAIEK